MGNINRSQFVTGTGLNVSSLSGLFSSAVSSQSLLVVFTAYFNNASAGVISTITDNVNNAGFNNRAISTMVSDTLVHLYAHDKLNLSSGAAASTYRVSINFTAIQNISFCAMEYTGGSTWTFGSTGSSNGTSTGPRGPVQTASSTPVLFVSGAVVNSTTLFVSTAVSPGTYVTTVDPTNANQVMNVVESTNSSLSQQLTHSLNGSTRWLAVTLMYTGSTPAGGAAATGAPYPFTMLGVQ